MTEPRRYTKQHPGGPRMDVDGVAWYACDPYPTWFRVDEAGETVTKRLPQFPTMPLDDFREDYNQDSNEWWRLNGGDQMNLFDAAIDRLEQVEALLAEMKQSVRQHTPEWFYMLKLENALKGEE